MSAMEKARQQKSWEKLYGPETHYSFDEFTGLPLVIEDINQGLPRREMAATL